MSYQVLDHTADYMVEVTGGTREELYSEAARALFDTLTDIATIRPQDSVAMSLEAADPDELLVAWLSELLFFHESQGFLFSQFRFQLLTERELRAEARGERFDPTRHVIDREIKAVTYHRLGVRHQGGVFKTMIVFDL